MVDPSLIDHTFEDLAQSLRVFVEAHIRATSLGLLCVDRVEAVGNIENALSSVLNAFHSMYDATTKDVNKTSVDWYKNGPLATILAIRNARHHNKANKIRTLYTYHARTASHPTHKVHYVLVDYLAQGEGAQIFEVYLSWLDFSNFLCMPRQDRRLTDGVCEIIQSYLGTSKFRSYALQYGLADSRVFFNVVPLIVNAAATIVPLISSSLQKRSTESSAFAMIFSDIPQTNMANPDVSCEPFFLPS